MAEHNASKTQSYIYDASRRFLLYKDPVERNLRAFAYLRGLRRCGDEPLLKQLTINIQVDPSAPNDVNLADAEHYMYARWLASVTGDSSTRALVTGYQLKKYIDTWRGREQDMRTNAKYPVLPPSMDAVRWGLRGVEDGLGDYKLAHGGKLGTLGTAFKENENFIKGQYGSGYGPKSLPASV